MKTVSTRSYRKTVVARQTGLEEKTLHRMLHRNGNPTVRNLGLIVRRIAEDLRLKPRVAV